MATQTPSWSRPLALAAALVALSSSVYWLEFKKKPATEKKKEQEKKIFALDDFQTAEITLIQGISTLQLHCSNIEEKLCQPGKNSRWEVTAPLKLRADDLAVQSLLSSLNNLLPTDSIDLSTDTAEKRQQLLQDYGLSISHRRAAQRVTITNDSGKAVSLVLGDPHPMGETRYALLERGTKGNPLETDESRVFLLPLAFKSSLSHPLTHWRDKKILTLQAADITTVQFEGLKSRFKATKKDASWTIDGTEGAQKFSELPGDIENVTNWLSSTAYLSAKEFAAEKQGSPEAQKALAGAKTVLSLTLTKGTEKSISLRLFEKKAKEGSQLLLTASNLDPVFELELGSRERLEKSISDLRLSRLLGSMDRFNAGEIAFSSKALGPKPVIFAKKDGKWARLGSSMATTAAGSAPAPAASPSASPASATNSLKEDDDTKISTLLDQLSGNRVKAFLQNKTPGKGALEISLKDEKAQLLRRLEFWREGEKVLARDLLSKRAEALELEAAAAQSLPWEKL
ncbi:MAG: hypothetical protein RJB38_90 [Pseudomonadota bacterium]|jgi:hypothetical protein